MPPVWCDGGQGVARPHPLPVCRIGDAAHGTQRHAVLGRSRDLPPPRLSSMENLLACPVAHGFRARRDERSPGDRHPRPRHGRMNCGFDHLPGGEAVAWAPSKAAREVDLDRLISGRNEVDLSAIGPDERGEDVGDDGKDSFPGGAHGCFQSTTALDRTATLPLPSPPRRTKRPGLGLGWPPGRRCWHLAFSVLASARLISRR